MSENPRKRDPKQSTPGMLRVRMREAYEHGKKMDIHPDEVTGVIDTANEIAREGADRGVQAVKDLIAKLNSSVPPPKPEPA